MARDFTVTAPIKKEKVSKKSKIQTLLGDKKAKRHLIRLLAIFQRPYIDENQRL